MVTAIIQARMSSARLPHKVLLPLGDTTILGHTVRRVQEARRIAQVVVATSGLPDDDAIAQECARIGVGCIRGSLEDVLDRYYQAARSLQATHVCRITADCPLIDPAIIDRVAKEYEQSQCDYISTGRIHSTFPDGLDTEIFSFAALERAWKEAKLPSEREHVTPYIWDHPSLFRIAEVKNDEDLSMVRLTIDRPEDYEVLKILISEITQLSMRAVVQYLSQHPEVAALNGSIIRDEGYIRSKEADNKP